MPSVAQIVRTSSQTGLRLNTEVYEPSSTKQRLGEPPKLKGSASLKDKTALVQLKALRDLNQSQKNVKLAKNTLSSKKIGGFPPHMSTLQLMQKTFSQNNIGKQLQTDFVSERTQKAAKEMTVVP